MLKKIIPLMGGLALVLMIDTMANAAVRTAEAMVVDVNPSTGTACQSISTSTYTQVPPASLGNFQLRDGIRVLNLPTNTANMGGIIKAGAGGIAGSAPTGITNFDLLFIKGNPDRTLNVGDGLYLWLISLHTSAETVCWQEYRQK